VNYVQSDFILEKCMPDAGFLFIGFGVWRLSRMKKDAFTILL